MALSDHLPSEDHVREFWPALVGLLVILVGNVYYHGVLGRDFTPVSPPLLAAIVIVAALEIGRALYARNERG